MTLHDLNVWSSRPVRFNLNVSVSVDLNLYGHSGQASYLMSFSSQD